MFHKIRDVSARDGFELVVEFAVGVTKTYDAKPLIEGVPAFGYFGEHPEEFAAVQVDVGGHGIVWNDELDLSSEELWENGRCVPTPFDGLMALSDATGLWGLNESTLRKAIAYGRLKRGLDVSKFGKQWVVSTDSMTRVYGVPGAKRLVDAFVLPGDEPCVVLEFKSGEHRRLRLVENTACSDLELPKDPAYLSKMSLLPGGKGVTWPDGPSIGSNELYEISVPA